MKFNTNFVTGYLIITVLFEDRHTMYLPYKSNKIHTVVTILFLNYSGDQPQGRGFLQRSRVSRWSELYFQHRGHSRQMREPPAPVSPHDRG